MSLAVRRRDDPAAPIEARVAIDVRAEQSADVMAALQGREVEEIAARFACGHRAWIAWRDSFPAAFGWVATSSAAIGELRFTFEIPSRERYLWNFVTLPEHRGLGIYPRLLDGIVRADAGAEQFWIAHAPENAASAAGILKAGFTVVADLSFDAAGRPAVRGRVPGGGYAAAKLLGIPHTHETLAQCWRCVRAGRVHEAACQRTACRCDYQRSNIGCDGTVASQL